MTDQLQVDPAAPIRPVAPGDVVIVVDERYVTHQALVTTVHGGFEGKYPPSLNVAYISADPASTDPYGRQVERLSSLAHYLSGPNQMPTPGRYWINQ
jgi:hypothetical protein